MCARNLSRIICQFYVTPQAITIAMEKKRYFSIKLEERLSNLVSADQNEKSENYSTTANQEESLFVVDENSDIEDQSIQTNNENATFVPNDHHLVYEVFESQIKSVVGTISSHAMNHLFNKYQDKSDYLKLAVQEYLQGIDDMNTDKDIIETSQWENHSDRKRTYEQEQDDLMIRLHRERQRSQEEEKQKSWNRFIGSLNVQAWATRPTTKPLKYLEKLELRRLMPKKLNVGKATKEKSKFGDSSIIRIYTIPKHSKENGREIGRIPEDITRILVPLIDLDISTFYTTVMIDTEKRLSTGDSFYIQIDCYLSENAFSGRELGSSMSQTDQDINALKKQKKMDTRARFDFSTETNTEAILRLRQYSLSKFFERLNIKPIPKNSDNGESINETFDAPIVIDSENEDHHTMNENPEQQNLDQLKQVMQANQQPELLDSLPDTTTPPIANFKLELRKYQRHGLSWMLTREREVAVLEALSKNKESDNDVLTTQAKTNIYERNDAFMNPLWDVFEWPKDTSIHKCEALQDENRMEDNYFYANMYNGELSLTKPVIRSMVKGGILADEMGLGKTISTLALINSVAIDLLFEDNKKLEDENIYASKTTLIIVPMSLLSQWQKEFDKANNNLNHKCLIYYGDLASTDLSPILCRKKKDIPIVMITTYGTVLNEFTRISNRRDAKGYLPKIGLFSVKFFRIVLDEGHNIRNRTAKTSKAVYELLLNRKWVLTGTPVINRLDDLYSLVKFLELEPWSNFSYWKTFVTLPFEQRKISQTLDVVKSILEPIFIRRTKNMKQSNGKPLVELPPKEVFIEEIKFNDVEEKLYTWFKARASQSFKEGIKSGDLFKKYSQILTHILRLRQVCCHVDLVGSANEMEQELVDPNTKLDFPETNGDSDSTSAVHNILNQYHADNHHNEKFKNNTEVRSVMFPLYEKVDLNDSECSICTQSPIPLGEMVLTPCGHAYCLNCMLEHFDFQEKNLQKPLCPNCREPISKYKIFKLRHRDVSVKEIRFHTKQEMEDPSQNFKFQLYLYDPTKTSSKIQSLINHLKILKEQSPNEQVVVFSQFSSYLDLIENELKIQILNDFVVYKFDGRLNMNERQKILEQFSARKHENKIMVLLLSLKAGGVGLNLTTASRAFMMDPWWSPSVEDQAIDRIHRIGQNLNVKVIRFIMADSIETKMLKIQERKKQIGEAVGAEEDEKRKRRIEEMQILFEDD